MHRKNFFIGHFPENLIHLKRKRLQLCVLRSDSLMYFERFLIVSSKMKTGKLADTRERHISLTLHERLTEINIGRVKSDSLTLMHRHRPRQTKRQLNNLSEHRAILLHSPFHFLHIYNFTLPSLDHGETRIGIKINYFAKRPIHESFFKIILRKHHHGSDFEPELLWRETTALQSFYAHRPAK